MSKHLILNRCCLRSPVPGGELPNNSEDLTRPLCCLRSHLHSLAVLKESLGAGLSPQKDFRRLCKGASQLDVEGHSKCQRNGACFLRTHFSESLLYSLHMFT